MLDPLLVLYAALVVVVLAEALVKHGRIGGCKANIP